MYTIKTLNNIAPAGLAKLGPAQFKVDNEADAPQGILVRSAKMHEMELPESLLAIGRAGAGVNNIPVEKCSEAGVVVFNTPGANAGGVAELTIGGLVLASRNLLPAMEWAQGLAGEGDAVPALVEKGKSQFVGPELAGKKLGVVGLGAIGVKVANAAVHLGMEVFGYDPYISVQAAWNLSRGVRHSVSLTELVAQCDYITLHLPANAQTKGFMNAGVFRACKPGLRLLNFARGELVNNADLLAALAEGDLQPSPGRFHPRERGELRRDGCQPAGGLPAERQYREQREHAGSGAGKGRGQAGVRHPQERARPHQRHHRRHHPEQAEHREHGEQEQKRNGLHHAGRHRRHGRRPGRPAGRHPLGHPGAGAVR